MRVVVDTNVLVSGIFFGGPPHEILEAWLGDKLDFVVTTQILEEYRRVAAELERQYPSVEVGGVLEFLVVNAFICEPAGLPHQVCEDPEDDKFVAVCWEEARESSLAETSTCSECRATGASKCSVRGTSLIRC